MAAPKRSAEEWRIIVQDWLDSGKTCKAFAADRGVNPSTLAWWKWKHGIERDPAPAPTFLEVVLDDRDDAPATAPDFVVEVDDLRVHVPVGFDGPELRRLVDILC